MDLQKLEELPIIKEDAMSLLKIFGIISCKALKILLESYFDIKTLKKIRVLDCSKDLKN
jgi:hypothetical protein